MCGIAGIHRRNGAHAPRLNTFAEELMKGLQVRGRDATGFLTIADDGTVCIRKDTVMAESFVKRMRNSIAKWGITNPKDVRTLMVHTRFATVGHKDDVRNAHPQASGKVAAVHNGTIFNDDELFVLAARKRHATVDSEAIPAIVDAFGWENTKDALELLMGGAAVALVNQDHPRDLILARVRDFPLCYVITDDLIVWASSPWVIERAWKEATGKKLTNPIFRLNDGEMLVVHNGVIELKRFEPMRYTYSSGTTSTRYTSNISTPATRRGKKNKKKGRNRPAGTRRYEQRPSSGGKHWSSKYGWSNDPKMGHGMTPRGVSSESLRDAIEALEDINSPAVTDLDAYDDAERELDIEQLMSDGFSLAEAETIVDDGLNALLDMLDLEDEDMYEIDWDLIDAVEETLHGKATTRGRIETKSPATLALESAEQKRRKDGV